MTRYYFLILSFFIATPFLSFSQKTEADVLKYANEFRKSEGLSPLVMKEKLNELARKHSEDMAKGKCEFGHDGFDERYEKVKKFFKSCNMAENVAYGASTGNEAVIQWENSPPHRENLLGEYRYTGIGTARDSRGRIYYTQIFVL